MNPIMKSTEQVVRLLKAAIAEQLSISLEYDFRMQEHCYVPIKIGDVQATVWKRLEITRIASVTFANGDSFDYEADENAQERWLPPRNEEFSWWYEWMNGAELMTHDEIVRESRSMIEKGREHHDHKAFLQAMQLADKACSNPWNYLTESEQDKLEKLLADTSKQQFD